MEPYMPLTICVLDKPVEAWLFIDGASGHLLALDDGGHDRMGLVDRAFLIDVLRGRGLWDRLPVYTDPTTPDLTEAI